MTADQMMKTEMAKGPRPTRNKLVLAGAALGAGVLVAGGFFGIRALADYRADIEQMQTAAAAYYDAAAEQAQLADEAADRAEQFATDASEAVTVAEAEAAEAEARAAAQRASNISNGLTPEGKCPAGTVAGAVDDDGVESDCQPTNDQGQQCVAYNDANQCTAWYKP